MGRKACRSMSDAISGVNSLLRGAAHLEGKAKSPAAGLAGPRRRRAGRGNDLGRAFSEPSAAQARRRGAARLLGAFWM